MLEVVEVVETKTRRTRIVEGIRHLLLGAGGCGERLYRRWYCYVVCAGCRATYGGGDTGHATYVLEAVEVVFNVVEIVDRVAASACLCWSWRRRFGGCLRNSVPFAG